MGVVTVESTFYDDLAMSSHYHYHCHCCSSSSSSSRY